MGADPIDVAIKAVKKIVNNEMNIKIREYEFKT